MMTRILTALVGIPLVLVCLFWPGGWPWFALIAAVTFMALYEYTRALAAKDIHVHWVVLGVMLTAGLVAAFPGGLGAVFEVAIQVFAPANLVLVVLFLLVGDLAWSRRSPVKNVGATLFGFAWLVLFGFLLALRANRSDLPEGSIVLAVLLMIWANDSAAYFVGKAIGKHKCAPAISPNKTWEGVFAGLAGSAAMGIAACAASFAFTDSRLFGSTAEAVQWGISLGLAIGVAGQMGDLVESAIKRELGIKDFGSLLPGHGGVLDRFDSLMFAAPVAFWLLGPAIASRILGR